MFVTTYNDAEAFVQATTSFLAQDEVTNGLMLGLALRLRRTPHLAPVPPFLATVQDAAEIVLAVLMMPPHNIILAGNPPALGDPFTPLTQYLLSHGQPVPGVIAPVRLADRFADTWAAASGSRCHVVGHLRVYELRQVRPVPYSPGRLRLAVSDDVPLLAEWVHAFQRDIHTPTTEAEAREATERRVAEGEIYLWDDHGPVSMAARARPTFHGITVNLVYTPPEQRRRGYATSCVARLSELLLRSGYEFCTLFADLANPTSNDIYQRIGYTQVADFHQYEFQ